MRQNKIHDFTWADQDWIGLMIFKTFADQDWIGFNFIWTGLGLKNFTVRSSQQGCQMETKNCCQTHFKK